MHKPRASTSSLQYLPGSSNVFGKGLRSLSASAALFIFRRHRRYSISSMCTRLWVYVSALLLALSVNMGSSDAQLADDGRCERITIPLCTGMKYNMTRMPNLVGISNQKDAALQVLSSTVYSLFIYRLCFQLCTLFTVA